MTAEHIRPAVNDLSDIIVHAKTAIEKVNDGDFKEALEQVAAIGCLVDCADDEIVELLRQKGK